MAETVNHTQRLIVQAIETLSQLEGRLKARMSVPDVVDAVDELINSLTELVSRAAEGDSSAAPDLASAQEALASESSVRGEGQKDRLCAG